MEKQYNEGTWFAVPLRNDSGFAVGVVARCVPRKRIILCYFFGPRRTEAPRLEDVQHLQPSEALRILRVSDLSLTCGDWPIIGKVSTWNREKWTMPKFFRHDPLSGQSWLVVYSDNDPSDALKEVRLRDDDKVVSIQNSLFGAGAVEITLTHDLISRLDALKSVEKRE